MKTTFIRLIDIEESVATIRTENDLLSKSNAKLLEPARWKGAEDVRIKDEFIESIYSRYLQLALHIKKSHCVVMMQNMN